MNRFRESRSVPGLLAVLILLFLFVSIGPDLLLAQDQDETSKLENVYQQAKRSALLHEEEDAITMLEELRATDEYKNGNPEMKSKICALLAELYDTQKLEDIFMDRFKELVSDILTLNQDFDFDKVLTKEELLTAVEQVKTEWTPPRPEPKKLFHFNKVEQQKAAMDKKKSVKVSTYPITTPVKFSIDPPNKYAYLSDIHNTSAILIFNPDSTLLGTVQIVTVRAESADTSKILQVSFRVEESKDIPKWAFFAGGGAVAVVLGALLIGGGGSDGGSSLLPDPPDHP